MSFPDGVPLSPRAKEHFEKVFKPKYLALLEAIRHVPLSILVWGPGETNPDLYRKRLQIRDELRKLGLAAFFSEELEGKLPQAASQKAIEFLQAQSADLIVVLESSYGSVAEVHDFASYRVINHKMLIFVDEAAADGYSCKGALNELKRLYNNVETFKTPTDLTECNLLKKVIEKVELFQMVKFRDDTNQGTWGLFPIEGDVS